MQNDHSHRPIEEVSTDHSGETTELNWKINNEFIYNNVENTYQNVWDVVILFMNQPLKHTNSTLRSLVQTSNDKQQ